MFLYEDVGHVLLENSSQDISVPINLMRIQAKCVDLQFLCNYGDSTKTKCRVINAHQAMFSSLSSLLHKIFQISREKQPFEKVIITLNSVDPAVVEKLIEYVYEGETFVNHQQQHALRDLCEMLEIDLPIRDFQTQSPCPIIGTIEYPETIWYKEPMPLTFLAEFPSCQFYDHWNASKEGINITIKLETKSLRPKREIKKPQFYNEDSTNVNFDKAVSQARSIVQECANNAIHRLLPDCGMQVETQNHIEQRKASRIKRKAEQVFKELKVSPNSKNHWMDKEKRQNRIEVARNISLISEEKAMKNEPKQDFSASRNTRLRNRVNLSIRKAESIQPRANKIRKTTQDTLQGGNVINPSKPPALLSIANRRRPEKVEPKIIRLSAKVESKKVINTLPKETKGVTSEKVYCICKRAWNRSQRGMIGCDFCEEWFHPECLKLSPDEVDELTEREWMCPVCCEKEGETSYSSSNTSISTSTNESI